MGYTYVCSELLYNTNYAGAVDAHYTDITNPFSVTYIVANPALLRRWFVERGMHYFRDEPENIHIARENENITRTPPFEHPTW